MKEEEEELAARVEKLRDEEDRLYKIIEDEKKTLAKINVEALTNSNQNIDQNLIVQEQALAPATP